VECMHACDIQAALITLRSIKAPVWFGRSVGTPTPLAQLSTHRPDGLPPPHAPVCAAISFFRSPIVSSPLRHSNRASAAEQREWKRCVVAPLRCIPLTLLGRNPSSS
jgi:hypothetical protein